jgi:cytochrome c2
MFMAALCMGLFLTACSGKKKKTSTTKTGQVHTKSGQKTNLNPEAAKGKKIASHNGCFNCHTTNGKAMVGPTLKNLYGHKVTLKDGSTITADTSYIIQSLNQPDAKIVAGYSNIMPNYGFLTNNEVKYLVAYLKSLNTASTDKH